MVVVFERVFEGRQFVWLVRLEVQVNGDVEKGAKRCAVFGHVGVREEVKE